MRHDIIRLDPDSRHPAMRRRARHASALVGLLVALSAATPVRAGSTQSGSVSIAGGSSGTITIGVTAQGSFGVNSGSSVNTATTTVGNAGNGTLTLYTNAVWNSSSNMILAANSGIVGTLNIGAAASGTPVVPGTLNTPVVTFGAGTGLIYFNHTDTSGNYLFSPAILGDGTIRAAAGYTVLTGNDSYSGTTAIDAGATLQAGNGGTTGSLGKSSVIDNGTLNFNRRDTFIVPGVISGNGAINQTGAGTTLLTGDGSAFTGKTRIANGVLRIEGTLGNGASTLAVAPGGTLSGSGTLGGNVTIADGGILQPNAGGNGGASTLTIGGDLVLGNGAILEYDLGQAGVAGGSLNDLTVVQGDLTLAGTLNVAATPGGDFVAGIYRIISYGGTLTDGGLAIGTIPASGFTVQTSVAGQVDIVAAVAPKAYTFWNGADAGLHGNGTVNGGNGVWQSSAGNTSWTDQTGTPVGVWSDGGFAIFMGAAGTVAIDDGPGGVQASGLQFASDGYLVQGQDLTLLPDARGLSIIRVGDGSRLGAGYIATIAANLAGGSQLLKTDIGTLMLTGTNTYSGGTAITDGTLQLGSATALGSGTLAMAPGTTIRFAGSYTVDNAITLSGDPTVDVQAGQSETLTNVISDGSSPGVLEKTGAGTLILTGANTYTGGTQIDAGTLALGAGGSIAASSATVATGATLEGNGTSTVQALALNGTLIIAGTAAAGTSAGGFSTFTVDGAYTGGGTVVLDTCLNDAGAPLSDVLNLANSLDGTTSLDVRSVGGTGCAGAFTTGNGIELVAYTGTASGTEFALSAPVVAGSHTYTLAYVAGQGWFLRAPPPPTPPSATPVPSLGRLALAWLALLLAGVAARAMRRGYRDVA